MDFRKTLDGDLRGFDQHLLTFKECKANEQPLKLPFDSTCFWVQIYDLPFTVREDAIVKSIDRKIGQVMVDQKVVFSWSLGWIGI